MFRNFGQRGEAYGRLVHMMIGISLIVAAAVLAAPLVARAQDGACENPAAQCGALLEAQCLTRMGAGVLAVGGEDAGCQSQLTEYRECLASVVEACPATRKVEGEAQDEASVDALAASLGRLGGLIDAPETPVDYVNNALVYARRGDALSTRRMYEKAIAGGIDAVDVHQSYSQLLKAQEGLIGAREIYGDLARRQPENNAAQLANALLKPADKREQALRSLVEGETPFAPAYYEIAALYSFDRLGEQTLDDRRQEKAALEAFRAADETGGVYRWFLQKEIAEIWRESVRRRLAAYEAIAVDIEPVTFTATPSNDSWMIALTIADLPRAIRYRIDGGAIQSLPKSSVIDRRTGEPTPLTFFNLPLGVEKATIEVWYDDLRNTERGPFELSFDGGDAFVAMSRNVLENITLKWIQDRDFDGRHLIYFTHLISHRCGLAEIAFGVDRETPDQIWPLSPCDPANPYAVSADDQIYLDFQERVGKIVIQLTYADGATSPVRVFNF